VSVESTLLAMTAAASLAVCVATNYTGTKPKDWARASNACINNGGVYVMYADRDLVCRDGAEFTFKIKDLAYDKPKKEK